ncbi:hypothetical protein QSH46_014810 [Xanthomonas arboricola pv. juglandis]|uniref:Uncharacterized protein n=2 Tax=Xanthomonas campestris pv. juglandis TaxID=195709 RepID=A0A9N8QNX2_XANCJ|nr:hypothetical protein [Xanthomonas arboricola]MDN0220940.1 hypothetical protein [Xanthomonas arboricola pv. juglandis]MDN0225223.1 hypothetical protein [Xanthomonas arboricola pv. juglandis]MDN0229548.1 hypothetical protein [Xanthomonas arboricola pv. juglandis]MDN0233849.1 hypothetical protein [Xanthomonas arboricola pv. juglandis]MDN0238266.1 hypothetical protein [Xanthomonas arboricola pv. juglandis]
MSASEVMRKSALLASVMRSGERRRLLASLPAAMATELRAQIALVCRHGWDEPTLVEPALRGPGQTIGDADGGPGLEDIVQLSHTLGAATLSRVVMATASADASFILAALEPALAKTVRAELAASRPLPPALAAAVRNAAHAQAAAAHPARRVVP